MRERHLCCLHDKPQLVGCSAWRHSILEEATLFLCALPAGRQPRLSPDALFKEVPRAGSLTFHGIRELLSEGFQLSRLRLALCALPCALLRQRIPVSAELAGLSSMRTVCAGELALQQ